MSHRTRPLVYLAGPMSGPDLGRRAFGRAETALLAAGFVVATPTEHAAGMTADDILRAVGADLDALAAADLLVTLPGSADLFEVALAEAFGLPVVALADVLIGTEAAR